MSLLFQCIAYQNAPGHYCYLQHNNIIIRKFRPHMHAASESHTHQGTDLVARQGPCNASHLYPILIHCPLKCFISLSIHDNLLPPFPCPSQLATLPSFQPLTHATPPISSILLPHMYISSPNAQHPPTLQIMAFLLQSNVIHYGWLILLRCT